MRPSLSIIEAAALISACNLAQTALEQKLNSARKKNEFRAVSEIGVEYADLLMARRKLEIELSKETKSPNT